MHSKRAHHTLRGILAISLLGACCLGQPVAADPVVLQEAAPATTENASPVELTWNPAAITIDDTAHQIDSHHTSGITPQERSTPLERVPATQPGLEPAQVSIRPFTTSTELDLVADIRSTLKESVRPLHDQVKDSGAMEAWNDLKTDIGFGRAREGDEDASEARPATSSQWEAAHLPPGQAPDAPPKTATQTEMDQELAAHMLERLIDDIKPWALSVFGLYLLGYLIKVGVEHRRQRSIRRRERRAARARRRSARQASSAKREA